MMKFKVKSFNPIIYVDFSSMNINEVHYINGANLLENLLFDRKRIRFAPMEKKFTKQLETNLVEIYYYIIKEYILYLIKSLSNKYQKLKKSNTQKKKIKILKLITYGN